MPAVTASVNTPLREIVPLFGLLGKRGGVSMCIRRDGARTNEHFFSLSLSSFPDFCFPNVL
jgi:hypothetical protein